MKINAMGILPTGILTFLFTDIEGSTKLWEQYPEAMHSILAKHDAILVQTVESNGGVVIETTGDGVHAVFDAAAGGEAAALAAQKAVHAEPWDAIQPHSVRVRMALHTGEAQIRAGDYFGSALNRLARLLSLGNGGQILIVFMDDEKLDRDHSTRKPPGLEKHVRQSGVILRLLR